MVCLNCGSQIKKGDVCGVCGVDNYIFGRVVTASKQLYNRGLKMAQSGDLTAAIDSLTKSVKFDKNNCGARNLLGLIYFETGRIGDALKNWVVSVSLRKEDNMASSYLSGVQQNGRMLDKYNDAVKLYNNSIMYLKQKNDDMAVIQLKKAVELNPKFIDALNLLTLCFLMQKDRTRAQGLIERVLAIDCGNHQAQAYAKEISLGHERQERQNQAVSAKKEPKPVNLPAASRQTQTFNMRRTAIPEIISFLFGAGICAALLFILVLPSMLQTKQDEIQSLTASSKSVQEQAKNDLDKVSADLEAARAENDSLKSQNAALAQNAVISDYSQKIDKANTLLMANSPIEAANTLYLIDTANAPADLTSQINDLKDKAFPAAATALLAKATADYNAKKYADATAGINKCFLYIKNDAADYPDAVMYSALIADASGDAVTAADQYNTIINDFPKSKYVSRAKRNLQRIKASATSLPQR